MSTATQRATVSQVIHLAAPPGRVFPLFEPLGEKAWAADWDPQMLYPADGAAEAGAVFTTGHAPAGESIWTMTVYDPATFHLAYLRVTPGAQVAFIEIQCADADNGTTRATVSYTLTGLSAAGNEPVLVSQVEPKAGNHHPSLGRQHLLDTDAQKSRAIGWDTKALGHPLQNALHH